MTKNVYFVRTPFLSGVSKRLTFTITDDAGNGFKPDTLMMSVYDASYRTFTQGHISGCPVVTPALGTIINDRSDVDMLASCSNDGDVDVTLEPADTTVSALAPPWQATQTPYTFRHVLFTIINGTGLETEKVLFILSITPDGTVV